MTHVTCRLTNENRDQLRNPTLGNRIWATFSGQPSSQRRSAGGTWQQAYTGGARSFPPLVHGDDEPLRAALRRSELTPSARYTFSASAGDRLARRRTSPVAAGTTIDIDTHTRTHARTRLTAPFSGTTQVSRYRKGKTNLDFTEARDSECQWHQLGHMHVCILLQTDNHASTPLLSFYRPDALPAAQPTGNSVKALKAKTLT